MTMLGALSDVSDIEHDDEPDRVTPEDRRETTSEQRERRADEQDERAERDAPPEAGQRPDD